MPRKKFFARLSTNVPGPFFSLASRHKCFLQGLFSLKQPPRTPAGGPGNPCTARRASAMKRLSANPLDLRAFLVRMPKGADLHYHLVGGIYAESWIRAAMEDGLCVDVATLAFTRKRKAKHNPSPHKRCGSD